MTLTIDFSTFGSAQWIVIIYLAVFLIAHAAHHGKPRSPVHVGHAAIGATLWILLLTWGGFFA